MATICSAVNTVFTPAVGTFSLQVTGGSVRVERRGTAGAAWATVGEVYAGGAPLIDNTVAGQDYRFIATGGAPVVQADQ